MDYSQQFLICGTTPETMVKMFFLICSICIASQLAGQPSVYTVANVHAHNDYEHNIPFEQAYSLGLGSIEADVLLIRDTLFVAHSEKQINRSVLFASAYLKKLADSITGNQGYAYSDHSRVLQLLIDIKTDSLKTLEAVIHTLDQYPNIVKNPTIRLVITGNQPPPESFSRYPAFLYFDGKLHDKKHLQELNRIELFSANFAKYSKWKGIGDIPLADIAVIKKDIAAAHALHKPFRFWGVPDNRLTWQKMMELGVDYINTDHISTVAQVLNRKKI